MSSVITRCALSSLVVAISISSIAALAAPGEKVYGGFTGKGDYQSFQKASELDNAGVALLNAKKNDEAIAKFKAAIELYPDHAKAHENLALAYRNKKQLAMAETECKKAVELEKTNWKAWRNLANILYDQKKYDEAIAAYNMALKSNPPPAKALLIKQDLQYVTGLKQASSKAR